MVFIEKSIPEDKIILREVLHICIVVRNVEKTARVFAEMFGIGPWRIREIHTPSSKGSVHGKPMSYTCKFGHARVGSIGIELAETVEGDTIYQEFLEKHGEGIHHIGFHTLPPFEAELEKWKKLGIKPLQRSTGDPEEGWSYMDTQKLVGCIIELLTPAH